MFGYGLSIKDFLPIIYKIGSSLGVEQLVESLTPN